MNKEALLNELANTTYVMIKPSPLHGIGVFAIRDIPKGTSNIFSKGVGDWIKSKQRRSRCLASTF